jgi:hypothetical protein
LIPATQRQARDVRCGQRIPDEGSRPAPGACYRYAVTAAGEGKIQGDPAPPRSSLSRVLDAGRSIGRAAGEGPRPFFLALLASSIVGAVCMSAVLTRVGHPALPLDDSFIHAQYARRLAEGSFYGYAPGEGFSTGATSPIWPLLLAPFYKLGFRGLSIVWVMWGFGTLAHAGLAVETGRIAARLAGRVAGVGAASMCLTFGAFAWFGWSGMETLLLAWVLMRAARRASALCELPAGASHCAASLRKELVLLGVLAPLVRPEGMLASILAAIALALRPCGADRPARPGVRLLAAIPLVGCLIVPTMNWLFAGHASSSTTTVKWLLSNPHYRGEALVAAILDNVDRLVTSLIDGGFWTSHFLPEGSRVPILLGLAAVVTMGLRRDPGGAAPRGQAWTAAFTLLIALGTLIPCTYLSFLWNRVRYLWPFAGVWFVGVACLARLLGDLGARLHRSLAVVTPLVCALAVGALASKLPDAVSDLAESAHAIDRQQVALGLWAAANLPADARIGVNDTGAISYFSERPTFDVVGLTTEGEARYWVAGPGSRYEHYEKLPRGRLPTHYIVYPQWMACPPVLGPALWEATVIDQSILGGDTKVVYEASDSALGSGALPALDLGALDLGDARLVDELDVSDLESEASHEYELAGGWDWENQVVTSPAPEGGREGDLIADGGRFQRAQDRFVARLPAGRPTRLVMRLAAERPADIVVSAGSREIERIALVEGGFSEHVVTLPADDVAARTVITVAARGADRFVSFHYWFYQPP